MKIIIAPNAFKGTLTAQQVAESIYHGLINICDDVEFKLCPVADGGDGSLPTIVGLGGGYYKTDVVAGPMNKNIECRWAIINEGNTVFIETALVYGLSLLPQEDRNPYLTTSRGIGELIKKGLDSGIRDFIIGVGGSANNDAGTGMLKALGCSFRDSNGQELADGGGLLKDLETIDISSLDERISQSKFIFLSDSSVPLVGEDGVSIMYSEGKGASKSMAQELDQSLQHYSKVFADCFGYDYSKDPGSGSGGGVVSAGQHFLNAKMEFGSDYFLENIGLEKEIRSADLVITAEGMICEQTIYNKAPIAVAKLAKKYDIPVVSVNALLGKNYELVFNHGIDAVISRRVNETSIMGMNDITKIAKQFGNECLQNGKITISKKIYLYEKI